MTAHIETITALEILDSRGFPTVRVNVVLDNGIVGTASVPSPAHRPARMKPPNCATTIRLAIKERGCARR